MSGLPIFRGLLIAFAILLCDPSPGTSQDQSAGISRKKAIHDAILTFDKGNSPYKAWLQQDVIWIITDEERNAFKLCENDDERNQFIEAFWERRNPTPDSFDNEYKDEHYRRIVYANEHFGTGIPGWKNDRGRMYIMFGPPDEIESYTARAQDKNPGTDPSAYPLEVWHYHFLEGIGEDVVLEFVDTCKCGEYNMPMTPARDNDIRTYAVKDLSNLRGAAVVPGNPPVPVGLVNPPRIKFKNLEDKTNSGLKWKELPFEVNIDIVRVTDFTSLLRATIIFRNHDLTSATKPGSRRRGLDIFGRIMTLTGRVSEIFEKTLDTGSLSGAGSVTARDTTTFVKTLALPHGQYRIEVTAEEVNSEHWGTWVGKVEVGDQ